MCHFTLKPLAVHFPVSVISVPWHQCSSNCLSPAWDKVSEISYPSKAAWWDAAWVHPVRVGWRGRSGGELVCWCLQVILGGCACTYCVLSFIFKDKWFLYFLLCYLILDGYVTLARKNCFFERRPVNFSKWHHQINVSATDIQMQLTCTLLSGKACSWVIPPSAYSDHQI